VKRAGSVLVGVLAIGFGCLAYSYVTLPDVRSLARSNPRTTAFMEIRDQEARDRAREPKRIHRWVNYNRISSDLKRAVLVAEDASFWDHDGVDYIELQKSIELDWARGQLTRGASTITQQLAKNLYLSPSKNPLRKLRELVIARRLEAELKKARILELYLNLIEWGDGIYGIEAAAREYFGTSAAALGPAESALLAGAIINPRLLNPHHPTPRLLRRQQIILGRMGRVDPPSEVAGGQLDAPEDRREASPENEHGERREDRRADPTETAPAAPEPEDEHGQPEPEESRAEASPRVDERAPERLAALPFHIPAQGQNT
jgi:monofunctional biosynthetic peptidoglycan transglycosylase